MKRSLSFVLISLALLAFNSTAHARVHHHRHHHHYRHAMHYVDANGGGAQVIGGRPVGCPHAYCGCGLRKYLGINDKSLDLAWNWAVKFPRTMAHPGAAAVRHHHVMLLVAHVDGSVWTVRDYNGGRHLSYIHERNVSGYVFVDPSMRVGELHARRFSEARSQFSSQ